MIVPFDLDNFFEVNDKIDFVVENEVVIIDNFYKNFEEYYKICTNLYVPSWKNIVGSRNFIDYYDCRPIIQHRYPKDNFYIKCELLAKIVYQVWEETSDLYFENSEVFIMFNYYKNIKKNVKNNMQFHPHVDPDSYNIIIYMDKVCSGGTAIYDMEPIENKEHENVLYDVTGIDKTIIQAKPNRCVIFKGDCVHGGYIEDHTQYENNWRINEVSFLQKK